MPRRTYPNTKPVTVNITVTYADGRSRRISFPDTVGFTYGYGDADGSWTIYPELPAYGETEPMVR